MAQLKRNTNQQSLGEVIRDFIKESGWQQKLDEVNIVTQWDRLFGVVFGKYVSEIFIQNRILHIRLKSATLRQELAYKKNEIVNQLNDAVGKEVITGIVLK